MLCAGIRTANLNAVYIIYNSPFVQKPFAVLTDWDTLNSSLRQVFAGKSPICYCLNPHLSSVFDPLSFDDH